MSSSTVQYLQRTDEILGRIVQTQQEKMDRACSIIADEIRNGKIIYSLWHGRSR